MLGPKMNRRDALKATALSGLVYTGTAAISKESFNVERDPKVEGVIVNVYLNYGEGNDKDPIGLWQTRRIGNELREEEIAPIETCDSSYYV